jgi:hypothetical protein
VANTLRIPNAKIHQFVIANPLLNATLLPNYQVTRKDKKNPAFSWKGRSGIEFYKNRLQVRAVALSLLVMLADLDRPVSQQKNNDSSHRYIGKLLQLFDDPKAELKKVCESVPDVCPGHGLNFCKFAQI